MSDAFQFETEDGGRPRAVMVGVQLPGVSDAELDSSLAELQRLAKTLGLEVVGRLTQRRSSLAAGKVLGDGKLEELARWTGGTGLVPRYEKPGRRKGGHDDDDDGIDLDGDGDDDSDEAELAGGWSAVLARGNRRHHGGQRDSDDKGGSATPGDDDDGDALPEHERATVVLVDHDLTPTQQRNLERATGAEVHDRTSVILGIFHRHARTREARMQVEIARLAYMAPRLREGGGGADRVRGGVGGKGAGESSLELDRRRIRDRIAELRRELLAIEGSSQVRRGRRGTLPIVALVGYTNAGKSSLMRALTGSEVYVADKLFATLDTTVRVLTPRTQPPILISDTVGFIKKLPHDLVASFRSTLEEAAAADLLLHLVDASDAAFRDHIRVTREVLAEVGVTATPVLIVLNKIDQVDDAGRAALAEELPDALQMSAKSPHDVDTLRARIAAHFLGELEDAELLVPWARHGLIHQIHEQCSVLAEVHEDDGTRVSVRAARSILLRLRSQLQ